MATDNSHVARNSIHAESESLIFRCADVLWYPTFWIFIVSTVESPTLTQSRDAVSEADNVTPEFGGCFAKVLVGGSRWWSVSPTRVRVWVVSR